MRPHVYRQVWMVAGAPPLTSSRWAVDFIDSCGCHETTEFETWGRALQFANRIASGVGRWHA